MVCGDSGSEVLYHGGKTLVVRCYSVRFPNFYILTRFLFADCNHFFRSCIPFLYGLLRPERAL